MVLNSSEKTTLLGPLASEELFNTISLFIPYLMYTTSKCCAIRLKINTNGSVRVWQLYPVFFLIYTYKYFILFYSNAYLMRHDDESIFAPKSGIMVLFYFTTNNKKNR